MNKLSMYSAVDVNDLAQPAERNDLSLSSPAIAFFTDFTEVKPLVIESSIRALDAKQLMQKAHVRLKFVLNDKGEFIGIISADDLADVRIMQRVSAGDQREHIELTDLMTPKRELMALDFNEVRKSAIGDVISALKDYGAQHCLVLDRSSNRVRGIFSASDISRKLHLPINIQDTSNFYKVFSATA